MNERLETTEATLPGGWISVKVKHLLGEPLINGKSVKTKAGGFPVLRLTCLKNRRVDLAESKEGAWTQVDAERYLITSGDFLVSRGNGSIRLVGRGGLVVGEPPPIAFPDTLIRVRLATQAVVDRYFAHAWDSGAIRAQIERKAKTTAGIFKINQRDLSDISLPVAPRCEQQRIVEALDSYLSRLDAAEEGLKRVEANLKRYRASVLKAAVEGRLVPTEAELARQEGRDYEPASVLLERILKERRRRWEEAELARMEAKGKVPKNEKWKAKYKEPVAPDTSELPELPEGWTWATLDQLSVLVRNGISKAPRELSGVSILRISAVRALMLDATDVRFLPGSVLDYRDYVLEDGDLLFTRYNGNPALVGACARVSSTLCDTVHPDKLIRVRLTGDLLSSDYVAIASATGESRDHLNRRTRTTAGQAGISGTDLKQMPVPLAPKEEQRRLSLQIDVVLVQLQQLERSLKAAGKRIERLRQSILKWAFKGKLVDQDPNDEPASALLERIRAERPTTRRRESRKRGAQMNLDI